MQSHPRLLALTCCSSLAFTPFTGTVDLFSISTEKGSSVSVPGVKVLEGSFRAHFRAPASGEGSQSAAQQRQEGSADARTAHAHVPGVGSSGGRAHPC